MPTLAVDETAAKVGTQYRRPILEVEVRLARWIGICGARRRGGGLVDGAWVDSAADRGSGAKGAGAAEEGLEADFQAGDDAGKLASGLGDAALNGYAKARSCVEGGGDHTVDPGDLGAGFQIGVLHRLIGCGDGLIGGRNGGGELVGFLVDERGQMFNMPGDDVDFGSDVPNLWSELGDEGVGLVHELGSLVAELMQFDGQAFLRFDGGEGGTKHDGCLNDEGDGDDADEEHEKLGVAAVDGVLLEGGQDHERRMRLGCDQSCQVCGGHDDFFSGLLMCFANVRAAAGASPDRRGLAGTDACVTLDGRKGEPGSNSIWFAPCHG
jgi:hypothetical protein